MYGSRNCVGGFQKPPTASVDRSRNQKILKPALHGHCPAQERWYSSEMENSLNSQSSRLNIAPVGNHDQGNNQSSESNNHSFVNHGLNLWNEQRRAWVGNRSQNQPPQQREPVISWSATYDELLSTSRPFSQPIPLAEMVDFLIDVWEQEGLYD